MDTSMTENFELPEGVVVEDEKTQASDDTTAIETAKAADEFAGEFEETKHPQVKRPMFAYWEVGGNKDRLKRKTAGIQGIENKYKKTLMMFLDTMPPLSLMLEIVHTAMQPWHKGVTIKHVQALYDKYTDDGGDHISFWKDIFIEVYKASGFFTQEMLQNLAEASQEK